MKNKLSELTKIGIFTSCALIVFIIEAQLPQLIPIPGIKPGLSNIVTLCALYIMGAKDAFIILILRVLLGSFFSGTPVTLIYSLSGGILAFISMIINKKLTVESQLPFVSISGAIFHNLGQIITAWIMMKSSAVFAYLPWLMISAVLTGLLTGVSAKFIIKGIKRQEP